MSTNLLGEFWGIFVFLSAGFLVAKLQKRELVRNISNENLGEFLQKYYFISTVSKSAAI